jgi:peptidoglycan/xylan/chitin deacetylase (PgdA/CDA1 family)
MTGVTPTAFVYPYGKYNDNTDAILQEKGFRVTLSCEYGINVVTRGVPDSLYHLKRICRSHGAPVGVLLEQAYKTLR